MTHIEEFLTHTRDGMRMLGAPECGTFSDFLLRNGRAFKGRMLPDGRYRMRMPRMCYWNTYRLVVRSKTLRYCEGYVATSACAMIPIQHAWAIDKHDQVVDVTLQDWKTGESQSGLAEYFGIVFERKHLDHGRKGSGLLWDYTGVANLKLWAQIDPSFKELANELG